MATVVKKYPGSCESFLNIVNPEGAYSEGGTYAYGDAYSKHQLRVGYYNFGFNIPPNSIINSVTMIVCYRFDSNKQLAKIVATLRKNGVTQGLPLTDSTEPTSYVTISTTNTGTWTAAELNGNTLSDGPEIYIDASNTSSTSVGFYLDYVALEVDYTSLVTNYQDDAVAVNISMAGVQGSEIASMKDGASPAAIASGGAQASELVTYKDSASPASTAVAGLPTNDVARMRDSAQPALAEMAGAKAYEAVKFLDTSSPAAVSLQGLPGNEIASYFDKSGSGAALELVGTKTLDRADMADIASPALFELSGVEGNDKATYKDTAKATVAIIKGITGSERATEKVPNYPVALQLVSTQTQLPISMMHEFTSVSYTRNKNEAARINISFPVGHPANKVIRDQYTAEPHGVEGILYRRGLPWAGVVLAETDITASPISWSFLGFEALLSNFKTPWSWHGLEGLTVRQALTTIAEKARKWHQVASFEGLSSAVLTDTEIKTWAQLSGDGLEDGAYNQPMVVLAKNGTRYKSTGTAVFSFDFKDQLPLERIRWRCSLGEYVTLAMQYRYSADGSSWTSWTDESDVADDSYAENYGVAAAGKCRYLEVKFTLRTEDTTTKDQDGNPVGTSPVLFGLEVITTYDTGIKVASMDIKEEGGGSGEIDEPLKRGFTFSHENHFVALASICEDYGYCFRVDHLRRLHVWTPAAASPIVIKKGETCEPQIINYRSLDGIENVITCYGAGDGLGRLSAVLSDESSVLLYGAKPGIWEDPKITSLTALQAKGQEELNKRAWPQLEAQIRAFYEEGRGILDAKVHDHVMYIDPDAFTGSDDAGQRIFEVTSEQREFSSAGEMVALGLDSDLDNLFTRQVKQNIKRNYRHGKAVGQVPFDIRAVGAFASIQILWHGVAKEYIVEHSKDGLDGWKALVRIADTRYTHTQLATGETGYYRVRAIYDGLISGPSLIASATTIAISPDDLDTVPPAVPSDLATTTGTTQTTAGGIVIFNLLSWTLGVEDDLAYYELRRSEDSGASWITVAVVPAGENRFLDTVGLREATTYQYQIRAMDKVGNRSDWSMSASVLTAKDAVAPTFLDTAPSVTAGFKRLVPRWHEAQAADISHYLLQRQTADAEWDNATNRWKVPFSPVAGDWADITASAIRALQYHDTDVLFDSCYRYRVAAVDTSGNSSGWTLPSAWIVPSQIVTADAAFGLITAEMYGELRQNLPYTWRMDVDDSHPIEVPFHIPSETTQIVSIKLSASGERFRANSKGASSGGVHSHRVDIPGHAHGIKTAVVTEPEVPTGVAGSHIHACLDDGAHAHGASSDKEYDHTHGFDGSGVTSVEGDPEHAHSVSADGVTDPSGGHNHGINISSGGDHGHSIGYAGGHSHASSFVVPMSTSEEGGAVTKTSEESDAHSHGMIYGIYEDTTPADVMLYVDNGDGYGPGIPLQPAKPSATERYVLASELDITAHIAGSGWKGLKLTSTRLGAIELQLICKVDITA